LKLVEKYLMLLWGRVQKCDRVDPINGDKNHPPYLTTKSPTNNENQHTCCIRFDGNQNEQIL
jgi:hypothetical protein